MAQITLGQLLHTQGVEALKTTDGALNVALTGHLVTGPARRTGFQTLIPRGIYTTNQAVVLNIPAGARGLFLLLRIYGVTGTFESNQGAELGLRWLRNIGNTALLGVTSSVARAAEDRVILAYPGAHPVDAAPISGDFNVTGLPVSSRMRVVVNISGTFSDGEGIDSEVFIDWFV